MNKTPVGELVYNSNDLVDKIMSGQDLCDLKHTVLVDDTVRLGSLPEEVLESVQHLQNYIPTELSVAEQDAQNQSQWHMPDEYKNMDIAAWVIEQCGNNEAELQRCGQELLIFQSKNLFPLLCYLKYMVDTMRENQIIWGVGRGSSVASYVLYKIGVHRVDSLYYDLDIEEFLR